MLTDFRWTFFFSWFFSLSIFPTTLLPRILFYLQLFQFHVFTCFLIFGRITNGFLYAFSLNFFLRFYSTHCAIGNKQMSFRLEWNTQLTNTQLSLNTTHQSVCVRCSIRGDVCVCACVWDMFETHCRLLFRTVAALPNLRFRIYSQMSYTYFCLTFNKPTDIPLTICIHLFWLRIRFDGVTVIYLWRICHLILRLYSFFHFNENKTNFLTTNLCTHLG